MTPKSPYRPGLSQEAIEELAEMLVVSREVMHKAKDKGLKGLTWREVWDVMLDSPAPNREARAENRALVASAFDTAVRVERAIRKKRRSRK